MTEPTRHLYLFDEVKESSVKPLIEKIHEINLYDDKKDRETYGNGKRNERPIFLHMNTPGGVVAQGLALIDTINISKTPIHTVGTGTIASMGIPIFISGKKRMATEHTIFMFHDISYGAYGTFEQHVRRMDMVETFMRNKVTDYILSKTNIRKSELEEANSQVKDWYFDVDEAIKLGVATGKVEKA